MVALSRAFRRMISHRRYRRLFSLITLVSVLALGVLTVKAESSAAPMSAPTYYYVANDGDDSNPGTSPDQPWRTLAPIQAHAFQPGDMIHFKRGSSWDGGLVIDDSGVEGNPITFTAYGEGDRPVISNSTGGQWTHAVDTHGSYVVVEGLLVRDAHEGGIYVRRGAHHNIIRDIEATNVGIGVSCRGHHNLITRNYIHDLHMVVDTPGGDDDFGAVGIWLFDSDNEVSYNTLVNCEAPSQDYRLDGGAIEWYGNADRNYVHHNWARDCMGFMEMGGGSANDTVVAYNVAVECRHFFHMHLSGGFASEVRNFRIENNTVVSTKGVPWGDGMDWRAFGFTGSPTADTVLMRNNIFYLDKYWIVSDKSTFTHENNLYHFADGRPVSDIGFSLHGTEIYADPLFVHVNPPDLHLQEGSPAIDGGANLGHTLDHEDNPTPVGNVPDIGAYEYRSGPQPTATSTLSPTATSTLSPTATSTLSPTATSTLSPTATPTLSPIATPTLTPTPTPNPNEIVVDNTDGRFSTSSPHDAWEEYMQAGGQHLGDSHRYNSQIGTGQDTATWSFTVPRPGTYSVYAWWWEGSWRPTDVPYTVDHLGGSTTVRLNQQVAGGQWNLLGIFDFQGQGSVVVSDDVSSGRDVVADAVRLVYLGPTPLGGAYRVFIPIVQK